MLPVQVIRCVRPIAEALNMTEVLHSKKEDEETEGDERGENHEHYHLFLHLEIMGATVRRTCLPAGLISRGVSVGLVGCPSRAAAFLLGILSLIRIFTKT